MNRTGYNILFGIFALIVPLLIFNVKYPFQQLITQEATEMATRYTWSFAGIIGLMFMFLFFRKQLSEWVKSFDRVGPLKGIAIWVKFVAPSAVWFIIVWAANSLGPNAVWILGWTFVSHMGAGVFRALALKAKAENFKNWVLE